METDETLHSVRPLQLTGHRHEWAGCLKVAVNSTEDPFNDKPMQLQSNTEDTRNSDGGKKRVSSIHSFFYQLSH